MSRIPSVLVSMATLALAACGSGKEPVAPHSATTAPADSSVLAVAATRDGLGQAVRSALDGDWEANYFDAEVDLNDDGTPEAVVYAAGPMVCGTGGCPIFVFATGPEGYRLVSRVSVVQPPIRLAPRSSQGWRHLVVGVGGGGLAAGNAELRFDGKAHPTNPTVAPAEPVTDLTDSEVLIPEFGSYTEGKPVPAQAYGDPKLPVAGAVLGTAIHTQDAEELRYVVLPLLSG